MLLSWSARHSSSNGICIILLLFFKLNLMSARMQRTYLGGGSPFASQASLKGRGWLPFDVIWNSTSRSSCCLIIYGGNDVVVWINPSRNKTSNCIGFCIVAPAILFWMTTMLSAMTESEMKVNFAHTTYVDEIIYLIYGNIKNESFVCLSSENYNNCANWDVEHEMGVIWMCCNLTRWRNFMRHFFHNLQTHLSRHTLFFPRREHLLPHFHSVFLALYQLTVIEHTISFQRTIIYENLRT